MPGKAGWTRVALGDVLDVVTEYWDRNPSAPERFVAGEHIDEGDLCIRRWGMTTDDLVPPTFNRRFRAGDVLFHSRNLKKLARPTFGGITGEKLFVLRSRNALKLLPDLVPFILQTRAFSEYVNVMWAGSTNKFLNKVPLLKFEFSLPPLEEQAGIAAACQAAEHAADQVLRLMQALTILQSSLLEHYFSGDTAQEPLALDQLVDRIIDYRGKSPPKSRIGIPLLTARNVRDGYIDPEPREFIEAKRFDSWMTRGLPADGDLIFTTEAPLANVALAPTYKFALGQRTVMLRANQSKVLPRYLYWVMRAPSTRREVHARSSGTTALGIKQSLLRQVPVRIHPREAQGEICRQLDAVDTCRLRASDRLRTHRDLSRGLMAKLSS